MYLDNYLDNMVPRERWITINTSKIYTFGIRGVCDWSGGGGAQMVAQTPPPTDAGDQDDGSYTSSLKRITLWKTKNYVYIYIYIFLCVCL